MKIKLIALCLLNSMLLWPQDTQKEQDSWWQNDGSLKVENVTDAFTFRSPILKPTPHIKENEMALANMNAYRGEEFTKGFGIYSKELEKNASAELRVFHRKRLNPKTKDIYPYGYDYSNDSYLIYGCKTSTNTDLSFRNQEVPWDAYGYYAHGYSFTKTQIKSTDYKHLWNRPKSATWWHTLIEGYIIGVIVVLVAFTIVASGGTALIVYAEGVAAVFAALTTTTAAVYATTVLVGLGSLIGLSMRYDLLHKGINEGIENNEHLFLIPQEELSASMEIPVPKMIDNLDPDSKKKYQEKIDKLTKASFECTDFPNEKCYRAPFKEVALEMKVKNSHIKYVNFPGGIHKNMTPYRMFKNAMYVTDAKGSIKASTLLENEVKKTADFFDVKTQILPRNFLYVPYETTANIVLENYEGFAYYYMISKAPPKIAGLLYIDLGVYGTIGNQNYNLYRFQVNTDYNEKIYFKTGPEGPFLAGDNIHSNKNTHINKDLLIYGYRFDDNIPLSAHGYSFSEGARKRRPINFLPGDSVVFVTKHKEFSLEGLPEIWLARAAGESKYYCTPSIKPDQYRPFLGYDSQVHGVALRKHPAPDEKKTPAVSFDKNTGLYKWSWIAQRRMDPSIKDNSQLQSENIRFKKYKTAQNFNTINFPIGGGQKVDKQRNNQREGYNMQLLFAWKKHDGLTPDYKNYDGVKYILGTDPDEIVYVGGNGAKIPSIHTKSPDALLKIDVEEWKKLPEGEDSDPIHEMVTAYQRNREFVINGKEPHLTPEYRQGYEILDKGNYRGYSIAGVKDTKPCNGKPCVKFFQDGIAEPDDNNKAPGNIRFGGVLPNFYMNIPVSLSSPQTFDSGFYGSIEGDQWPSEWQKNVPYSFTGLSGLSDDILNSLVMEYTHENELGILTKDTRYFRDGGLVDGHGKWTEHFDIKGWGYNEITVYMQRRENAKMVPIAGMELLEVMVRFVSAPGSKWKDFSPTKFEGIDLKDGRGEGNYWYLRDANEDISDSPIYGKPLDDINKTYTISKGDRVVFTAMDSDPHTFFHYDVEWYLSERFMAKRLLPDDLNYRIQWFLAPVDHEGLGEFVHKGRWFDKTFDIPGKYRLTAVYGKDFDKNDDNYNHTRMSHEITVMPRTYDKVSLEDKGDIEIHLMSQDQISWLQANNPDASIDASWRVAEIDNIYSKWTHVDGPRAEPPNDKPNRYGLENDYNANFKWVSYYYEDKELKYKPSEKYLIDDSNLEWFPSNWIRHYSGSKLPKDMDVSQVPGKITSVKDSIDMALESTYPNNLPESWQWRLPWVSLTNWQGYRTRANIKAIFDMRELFDNETGAFSGKGVNKSPEEYAKSVSNPIPKLTDKLKSKYDFYLDLLSGRKIVYNPATTNPANLGVFQVNLKPTKNSTIVSPVLYQTEDFLMGADMSIVKNLEDEGITWTESGLKKDPYDILSSAGANIARFRLWVSPKRPDNTDYTYSTLSSVTDEIKRAKAQKLKVLLDLHYSDTWTDPKQNIIPSDWSTSTSTSALENSIKEYTKNVLQHLKDNDALPDIVQVGNEINGNLLLSKPYDKLTLEEIASEIGVQTSQMNGKKDTINWDRNAILINAGLSAVRDFSSVIKTMLHIAGPLDAQYWLAQAFNNESPKRLGTAVVDKDKVDIIGVSYYNGELAQQQTIPTVMQVVENIGVLYGKHVLIAETAFPSTYGYSDDVPNLYAESSRGAWPKTASPVKQLEWLVTLRESLRASEYGIGFLYWEPFWVGSKTAKTKDFVGSNWENMTFFKFANGVPTEANELDLDGGIKVFSATASTVIQSSAYSKIILVADTETPEISEVDQLKYTVYPNPTADELTITFHEGTYDYLELLDSKGRVLYEYSFNGKLQHIISTKDLQISTGFILLRLSSKDGNTDVKKVIVK